MARTPSRSYAAVLPEDPAFVSLDSDALATVVLWQTMAGPQEICGFCVQDEQGVQHVLQIANHAASADEFETSQSDEQILQAAARQRRWRILAFFHTHPYDVPELSRRDRHFFEADTMPWIIVGTSTTNPCQCTYY